MRSKSEMERALVTAAATLFGVTLCLVVAPATLAASPPPTSTAADSVVADGCPTLRWSAVPGATAYALALVALPPGELSPSSLAAEAVLHVTVTEGATAWRPQDAWCPRDGQRYAWAVRPLAGRSVTADAGGEPVAADDLRPIGDWSGHRLFTGGTPGAEGSARRLVAELEARLESQPARDELREVLAREAAEPAAAPSPGSVATVRIASAPADRTNNVAAPANAGGPVQIGPHFIGTAAAQDFELRLDGERALLVRPTAGTPNLVFGSSANSVVDGVVGATIAGGGGAGLAANQVRDHYGTVGGGRGNSAGDAHEEDDWAQWATVGGGNSNIASGRASTVGGGTENVADGLSATVAGGLQNIAANSYSSIGGGQWNDVPQVSATVPGGSAAKARQYAQLAYAAGGFGGQLQPGDAQWSLYVLMAETTDATPTQLFLSNIVAPGHSDLALEVGQTLAFRAHVAAMDATGATSAGYRAEGLIKNVGGATSFVGIPTVTVLGEDVASWNLQVVANDTDDSLDFIVTGAAATEIRWVATVRATEVRF